jgi:hypothetical protein
MTDKLEDAWTTRDYPVLREVTRLIDSREDEGPGSQRIAEATGLDDDQVQAAGLALERRGLVQLGGKVAEGGFSYFHEISGAAYLITGLHPDGDDALSRLIDGLRQAAEQTVDEDEKGRLRRAADALGGITRDVGVGVLTAVITRGL